MTTSVNPTTHVAAFNAARRAAVLARAQEYCALSNQIGSFPDTDEGLRMKRKLLHERVHPMYHPDVDMFGLVGKDKVVAAVDEFFLKTYADRLRFESVLNGNVDMPPDWQDNIFGSDGDTQLTFEFARSWYQNGKQLKVRGVESVQFEKVGDAWLAKRFAFIKQPGEPEEVIAAGAYMLTVHVTFPDAINRDKWLSEVSKLAQAAQQDEPGCLTFSAAQDEKDPLKMLLLERYVDKAAFEAHKRTDAFKAFVQALPSIDRKVDASYFTESIGFNREVAPSAESTCNGKRLKIA